MIKSQYFHVIIEGVFLTVIKVRNRRAEGGDVLDDRIVNSVLIGRQLRSRGEGVHGSDLLNGRVVKRSRVGRRRGVGGLAPRLSGWKRLATELVGGGGGGSLGNWWSADTFMLLRGLRLAEMKTNWKESTTKFSIFNIICCTYTRIEKKNYNRLISHNVVALIVLVGKNYLNEIQVQPVSISGADFIISTTSKHNRTSYWGLPPSAPWERQCFRRSTVRPGRWRPRWGHPARPGDLRIDWACRSEVRCSSQRRSRGSARWQTSGSSRPRQDLEGPGWKKIDY